jgi:subtilisin family serine protease
VRRGKDGVAGRRWAAGLAGGALVLAGGLSAAPQSLPVPTYPAARPSPEAVIRFEGGTVAANVPAVLRALAKAGRLDTSQHTLARGQNVCRLYGSTLRLPGGCTREMTDLARQLNPGVRSVEKMRPGQVVAVPETPLKAYEYSIKLDRRVADDRSQIAQRTSSSDPLFVRRDARSDGSDVLVFTGFELRVPVKSDAELDALLKELASFRSLNVIVTGRHQSARSPKLYSFQDPGRYWDECRQGQVTNGEEAHLGLLLSKAPAQCTSACTGPACPEVILIDTAVTPHFDLRAALLPAPDPMPSAGSGPKCRPEALKADEHGTHLAGIIGAGQNQFGVVGMHPGARIVPLPLSLGDDTIFNYIRDRSDAPGVPVYVFATHWEDGPPLANAGERISYYPLAVVINGLRPLVIAAAGNEGKEITDLWPRGPMNLGDLPNVVVVGACEKCGSRPTVLPQSNRSARKVHLLAPGKGVPSTVGSGDYVVADGTSPATAFVAGVTSAMLSCYPQSYARLGRLKTRLQATALPFAAEAPGQPRSDRGLAAGILDPDLALRDPERNWVKESGGDHQALAVRRWLTDEIVIADPVTPDPVPNSPVRAGDILRLVQVPGPSDEAPKQWVIYKRVPFDANTEHLGEVIRVGPGRIRDASKPILEVCGGRQLRLADLEDVLLSHPIRQPQACP